MLAQKTALEAGNKSCKGTANLRCAVRQTAKYFPILKVLVITHQVHTATHKKSIITNASGGNINICALFKM